MCPLRVILKRNWTDIPKNHSKSSKENLLRLPTVEELIISNYVITTVLLSGNENLGVIHAGREQVRSV